MMENYFTIKYYEEIAALMCGVIGFLCMTVPIIFVFCVNFVDNIKQRRKSESEDKE